MRGAMRPDIQLVLPTAVVPCPVTGQCGEHGHLRPSHGVRYNVRQQGRDSGRAQIPEGVSQCTTLTTVMPGRRRNASATREAGTAPS